MFTPRTIRWSLNLVLLTLVANPTGSVAQKSLPPEINLPEPVKLSSQDDHQRLMDLLRITEVRRGRDGNNKESPFYANYDESKANPYPNLPDPLVMKNGKKVTKASEWWSVRRREIQEDFDREVYGRVPANVPAVKWEVTSTTNTMVGDIPVITKQLEGTVDNSSYPLIAVKIQLILTTPANATGSVPVVMVFGGFGFGFGGGRGPGAPAAAAPPPSGPPYLPNAFTPPPPPRGGALGRGAPSAVAPGGAAPGAPAAGAATPAPAPPRGPGFGGPTAQQQLLAKGWGWASLNTGSIQADNGYGLTLGIIGLVNKGQPRKLDDWGVLRAWAWGASRALDYFETDKSVNAKRVGLEGHSRWGKATIVAMAYDQRFWTAYVSSSGEGGAKLNRRDWGEIVENVAGAGEYHWMAGNFIKYSGPLNWGDLPVDAHELVAMCAPRPVFISGGATNGDGWVDAKGMFMAAAAAGPVYKLLGKKDLGTTEFPPIEIPLVNGDVAFRQHSGGHTDAPNWPTFLAFADRYVK